MSVFSFKNPPDWFPGGCVAQFPSSPLAFGSSVLCFSRSRGSVVDACGPQPLSLWLMTMDIISCVSVCVHSLVKCLSHVSVCSALESYVLFVACVVFSYLLTVHSWSFHLLNRVVHRAKPLHFDGFQFIIFFFCGFDS